MTRRPSATAPGNVANELSSSTSWATARAAELPAPIAMPMSASLSASTSFTPSPVIATTCPRACSAFTIARFWCGVTRPKTVDASSATPRRPGSSGKRAGVDRILVGDATPTGDGAHRRGVVARDDLDRHALLGEVGERVGGVERILSSSSTSAFGVRSDGGPSPFSG